MSATTLLMGLFLGLIGSAYFLYGKKQNQALPMLTGCALCVLPYFISSNWLLLPLSLGLMALPFVFKGS